MDIQTANTASHDKKTKEKQFLEECRSKLEALENIRLIKLASYNFRQKIAIPTAAIALPILGYIDYWLLKIQSGNDESIAGLSFIAGTVLWQWVISPKRQYAKSYKKDILPEIARLLGGFTYKIGGKIKMRRMKPSLIVPSHDSYTSEDYFKGSYKDIDIEFSEIKLTEERGSGKSRRTVTVFNGLNILLALNHKKFYGHTILDKDMDKLEGWFKEKNTTLKRANLVDPEFEKIFDVYTNDQVEARYLIDPTMIEDLKELYMEYEGKGMAAAFYEEKMLIMISSSYNHFEPADIYTPATKAENILTMKREVGKVLSIVDKLSLHNPATTAANNRK